MTLKWFGLTALILMTGCATVKPEVRMIPTGDHGVGVRFSRGNALMVSNGPSGAIMLLPVRYNDTKKFFFSVAAFNTSGHPINIGAEDVRLYPISAVTLWSTAFIAERLTTRRSAPPLSAPMPKSCGSPCLRHGRSSGPSTATGITIRSLRSDNSTKRASAWRRNRSSPLMPMAVRAERAALDR